MYVDDHSRSSYILSEKHSKMIKTTIGGIPIYVREGLKAAFDIGTSESIICHDEYQLRPFIGSKHKIDYIVDIGANIGAFSLMAHSIFPEANILAIEADPENYEYLTANCGEIENISLLQTAALYNNRKVYSHRNHTNSGGYFVHEIPDTESVSVPSDSINNILRQKEIPRIDILKVDTEGCEVEIFRCLVDHDWMKLIKWIRFEWHNRSSIPLLRDLISKTHKVLIDLKPLSNGFGIAHRYDIA